MMIRQKYFKTLENSKYYSVIGYIDQDILLSNTNHT